MNMLRKPESLTFVGPPANGASTPWHHPMRVILGESGKLWVNRSDVTNFLCRTGGGDTSFLCRTGGGDTSFGDLGALAVAGYLTGFLVQRNDGTVVTHIYISVTAVAASGLLDKCYVEQRRAFRDWLLNTLPALMATLARAGEKATVEEGSAASNPAQVEVYSYGIGNGVVHCVNAIKVGGELWMARTNIIGITGIPGHLLEQRTLQGGMRHFYVRRINGNTSYTSCFVSASALHAIAEHHLYRTESLIRLDKWFRNLTESTTMNKTPVAIAASTPAPTAGPTMTSREIAELTGKDHKNVLADIRDTLEALGLTSADFSADLPDAYGRPQPIFRLPRDLTLTLVTGYRVDLRHRVVTRWLELEAQVAAPAAPQVPQTMSEALRLAADLSEKNEAQAAALLVAQPKVEFVDRYVTAPTGSKTLREVCKLLGAKENQFVAWLLEKGLYYRTAPTASAKKTAKPGMLTPYAKYMEYFATSTVLARKGEYNARQCTQYRFNARGVVWVTTLWDNRNAMTKV